MSPGNPKKRSPLDPGRLAAARESVLAGVTIREAAERFGLNYEALKRRASREAWPTTSRVRVAAARARIEVSTAATEAVAASFAERGRAYLKKLANTSEKFAGELERMEPEELLNRARSIETLDKVARRTFSLDDGNSPHTTIIGIGIEGFDEMPILSRTEFE